MLVAWKVIRIFLFGPARWTWIQSHGWAWFGGLFIGGFTVAGVNEFGLAVILLSLAAISCASQLWKWKAEKRHWALVGKTAGSIGIVFGLIYGVTVINEFRGERDWSQFPSAVRKWNLLIKESNEPLEKIPPEHIVKDLAPYMRDRADKQTREYEELAAKKEQEALLRKPIRCPKDNMFATFEGNSNGNLIANNQMGTRGLCFIDSKGNIIVGNNKPAKPQ